MTDQERNQVLKMIEDGRISPEEGLKLLQALEQDKEIGENPQALQASSVGQAESVPPIPPVPPVPPIPPVPTAGWPWPVSARAAPV